MKAPVTRITLSTTETTLFELKKRYLEEHGWKYTCETPGAIWLWRKIHLDEVFMCNLPMALCIEEALSAE